MSGEKFNPLKIATGEMVGPYEVVGLEAEGGYGYLYRVRRDGKTYALKIGRYDFAGQYPDDRERDEERQDREIAAMKTLHHPNIVRVLAFDRWPDLEGGFPYFVMEFVEGRRLDEWQFGVVPALDRLVTMYEKIALAIDYMHAHGIFHRDLKAQNVIVRPDLEPVVLDFGLARPRYSHEVTRAGIIGTVSHFAPEYVRWSDSAASVTEPFIWQSATDLYALGYMLYEALAGVSPFAVGSKSRPDSDSELLLAIKKIVPKHPSSWNPKVPSALDDLVMQLLAKEPEQRPKSAGAVAEVLRQAREAAEASGDQAWVNPFDRPARSAAGPAELIEAKGEAGPGSLSLPTRRSQDDFADEPGGAAPTSPAKKADPMAETIAAMKAQVTDSVPRRRASPIILGGLAIVVALTAFLVIGGLQSSEREGPKTLLSTPLADAAPSVSPSLPLVPSPASSGSADPADEGGSGLTPGSGRAPDQVPERIEATSAPVPKPAAHGPDKAPIAVSRSSSEAFAPLQRSQRIDEKPMPPPGPPRPRGIPYGSHIRARLLSNLDSRTIGSGPVEAVLDFPHVVRGVVALPVRTMLYGTASETSGRFMVRFTRLRLPDDTELAFEAIALARDDGKPGLAASRRIERPPELREGVATQIAKGTGNILLDTIAAGTPGALARNAGQTVLSQDPSRTAPDGQWALLLDAGVVFDAWVESAF